MHSETTTEECGGSHIRSGNTVSGTVEFLNPYTLQDSGSTWVVEVQVGGPLTYHDTAPH